MLQYVAVDVVVAAAVAGDATAAAAAAANAIAVVSFFVCYLLGKYTDIPTCTHIPNACNVHTFHSVRATFMEFVLALQCTSLSKQISHLIS